MKRIMPAPELFRLSNTMYDFDSLTVSNVPALWERRDEIFKDSVFDMGQMQSVDSAGIAFLAQWALSKHDKKLKLQNVSDSALALIKTLGVSDLFDAQKSV